MIRVEPVTLEDRGVRLEPLSLAHHDELEAAAADGRLWELWYTTVPAPGETTSYIETALAAWHEGHRLAWAVRDLESDRVIGSTSYHDIVPRIDRVEIGYTWYGASWQRTHVNSVCKRLLFAHAFETLGCQAVGLRTDRFNQRSQRAIEALGAHKDGVLRRFQPRRDGSVRDTVVYSVLVEEWPEVRRLLDSRLTRHAR